MWFNSGIINATYNLIFLLNRASGVGKIALCFQSSLPCLQRRQWLRLSSQFKCWFYHIPAMWSYCRTTSQASWKCCYRTPKPGLLTWHAESRSLTSGCWKSVGTYCEAQSKELAAISEFSSEEWGVKVLIDWRWGWEVHVQLMSMFLIGQWWSWPSSDWSVMPCSLGNFYDGNWA